MSAFWQQMIICGALALSAAYLGWHYLRRRKVQAGCKSCPALKMLKDSAAFEGRFKASV